MTACDVPGCTTPATRTVQIQAPGWRVPESRRVCIAHAESISQEPPMSKTLTQAERVLEDVKNHPWTTVGDVVRRTRDAKAAARLVEAVQAGRIVRIGEQRSYRYAMPGTPIPGLVEVAPVEVEESPEWGVADAPEEAFGRPMTLAERLARATGVDLTRGDVGLVEAVEAAVAERDALRVVWESVTTSVGMGGHKPEAIARDVERQIREKYSLARQLFAAQDLLVEALEDYQGQVADGVRALVAQRDASRAEIEGLRSDLEAERQASEARAVTLDGIREALGTTAAGRGLVEAVERIVAERDAAKALAEELQSSPFATPAEVTQQVLDLLACPPRSDILATANASLREIGGGIAKRRVGCTVALGSGSAFFPLSDAAAQELAPLLFQGVTVALLAPVLSKPTPVVPEFPSAPTPDDDADLFAL